MWLKDSNKPYAMPIRAKGIFGSRWPPKISESD